jgi:hypothetical protein
MLTPNVETIGSKNYSINKQFLIMKKQLLLLLFSLFAVAGYARVISGTVIAESDKLPVIGATVIVQGTQRGVATDFDGNFSIEVKDGDILNVIRRYTCFNCGERFVGYTTYVWNDMEEEFEKED